MATFAVSLASMDDDTVSQVSWAISKEDHEAIYWNLRGSLGEPGNNVITPTGVIQETLGLILPASAIINRDDEGRA